LDHDVLRTCCKTLYAGITTKQGNYCDEQCKNNLAICCISSCVFNVTGVYIDGQFHTKTLLKMYDSGPNQPKELWMPIIEKSIEKCEKLSNFLVEN
jgi:hypothetical protein